MLEWSLVSEPRARLHAARPRPPTWLAFWPCAGHGGWDSTHCNSLEYEKLGPPQRHLSSSVLWMCSLSEMSSGQGPGGWPFWCPKRCEMH